MEGENRACARGVLLSHWLLGCLLLLPTTADQRLTPPHAKTAFLSVLFFTLSMLSQFHNLLSLMPQHLFDLSVVSLHQLNLLSHFCSPPSFFFTSPLCSALFITYSIPVLVCPCLACMLKNMMPGLVSLLPTQTERSISLFCLLRFLSLHKLRVFLAQPKLGPRKIC